MGPFCAFINKVIVAQKQAVKPSFFNKKVAA